MGNLESFKHTPRPEPSGHHSSLAMSEPSETSIPMTDASVIAAPSSSDVTYSDPTSILHNNTWLLQDNEPGYWTASFSFAFTPAKLRLWNAEVDGSGTKTFSVTPQSSAGISNFSYVDPATSEAAFCTSSCPLAESSDQGYQDFFFVNSIGMNAFRMNIDAWYGACGGLKGIALYGTYQASSNPSTSSVSSTLSSTTSSSSTPTSSPTSSGSPQASKSLSGGVIAGIAISVITAVVLAMVSFIVWQRSFRRKHKATSEEKFVPLGGRHEFDADGISRTKHRKELGGQAVSELEYTPSRQELEGSTVPELPADRSSKRDAAITN